MRTVTFLVLEGVDKGRVFRDLPIPVTIGREEGNALRLNDERVSRYHAKVQVEDNDIILTDLDSINETRVNGTAIQIRRLRPGDQMSIGRSMLLFGTMDRAIRRRYGPDVLPFLHGPTAGRALGPTAGRVLERSSQHGSVALLARKPNCANRKPRPNRRQSLTRNRTDTSRRHSSHQSRSSKADH